MFSIRDAYGFGWRTLKEHSAFLIGVHLIAIALQMVPQMVFGDSSTMGGFGAIASALLSMVTALGLVYIYLGLVDGDSVGYGDLFYCAHMVFKYLVASIIYALIILCGLLLLIVPGFIWMAQFGLWPYLVVEQGMGPIEALKESSRMTKGTRGKLVRFYLLSIPIMIIGTLLFLVGAVPAYAIITVAGAYVYRKVERHNVVQEAIA